jgi:catechol 2,3-dioxygenase-like lactoylglutathione lyase family enzyme
MSALRALGALASTGREAAASGSECTTWENTVASQRFAPPADRLGLYCVEIRTGDWDRSVRWYRETLGLKVLVRVTDDGYALLEMGTARLALIARDAPGAASPRFSLGLEVENLDAVFDRLMVAGSEVTRPKGHAEGFREIITSDPDGNHIRLFSWPSHAG